MPYLQADSKGEIIAYRETSGESLAGYIAAGERLVEADEAYPAATHYVNNRRVVERPAMPLIVSGRTITGIPAGSVLTLGEQAFEVDDGEADITGYSGTVKITCWPYLDAEVVV